MEFCVTSQGASLVSGNSSAGNTEGKRFSWLRKRAMASRQHPGALVQFRHVGLPFFHLVNQHQVALLQEVAVVGLLSIRRTQTQKADELSVSGNELLGLVLDMFIYRH